MTLRMITLSMVITAILSESADARLFCSKHSCRPAKCCGVQQVESCESYTETAASPAAGAYNAFAGSDGAIYAVNTYTGQVYKSVSGDWVLHTKAMPH
jgi:hypothetical protein